ncbi:MAG: hypothetical protein ACREA2_09740 [Blastocatellia bacterium]
MNRSRIFNFVLIVSLSTVTIFSACASAPKEVQPEQSGAPTPAAAESKPGSPTIAVGHDSGASSTTASSATGGQGAASGSVKWTPPAGWEAKPSSGMRAATYIIPAAKGASEGAECAVFANLGGGVQANITRWIGQFEKTDSAPNQKSETINGLPVTTVDVGGTFKGGGPMTGQPSMSKPGYRLLGAIVEGPEGDIFFKLTGPAKTVAAAQGEFQAMLKSLKR